MSKTLPSTKQANTLITNAPDNPQGDRIQALLLKFGSTPKQSIRWFITGLFCFLLGVICIYLGPVVHIWLQVIGLGLIAIAILFAARGYVGILANRLAFFRHNAAKNRQRYKHLE